MIETIQRIQQLATTNALVAILVITLAHLSLPVLKRASKRGFAVFCVFAFAAAVVAQKPDTNAPPGGAANPPRMEAISGAPMCGDDASYGDESDPVGPPGLQITDFALETNGVTIGSCWSPDLGLTGLGLFHSPFVNSNDWTMLDQWDVLRGATNDVHAVSFGGAFTNSVAGFFRLYGYPDPERALYTTIGLTLLDPNAYNEVTITGANGFDPDLGTLRLEYGVTNEVLIRVGQRYTVVPWWNDTFALSSEDPFVSCAEAEYEMTLSVCRPVRVLLSDIPPPEDAARCPLGHVHARYCSFSTDPELRGELTLYDTACIAVDNTNHTLRISTSWAPGHRSAYRLMEDFGALGTFTETNGTVDLVFDDLCPHSVGSAAYCLCGQSFYCPDCIGSTAAWHNLMLPDLLTATNAPDGSVSLDWHDSVASNAYYFVELATTNHSRRFTITPRLPTMTRDYLVQASSGMKVRIPLLAGVPYTVSTDYGDFTVTPETGDVVIVQDSPRSFTVERPLTFGATHNAATELRCPAGHVHTRRYRVVTNIPDIPGTVEIDETKCIAAAGDGFAVTCDGVRSDGCASEGVVTGRFIYEGVTKSFAITNSEFCVCDNLHHPTCPCGAASLCNECDTTIYGQDENWVRANFDKLRELDPSLTSAEDILSRGYLNWVDRRVGYGLENGLYKLTVSFTNQLTSCATIHVDDMTVSATNQEVAVFLLEKAVEHSLSVEAGDDAGISIEFADDCGTAPVPMALANGGPSGSGRWSADDRGLEIVEYVMRPLGLMPVRHVWHPKLVVSPAMRGPDDWDTPWFVTATVEDAPASRTVSYRWHGTDGLAAFSDPDGRSTYVFLTGSGLPSTSLTLTVEARVGSDTLESVFSVPWQSVGAGLGAIVSLRINDTVFVNNDDDDNDGDEDAGDIPFYDDDLLPGRVVLSGQIPADSVVTVDFPFALDAYDDHLNGAAGLLGTRWEARADEMRLARGAFELNAAFASSRYGQHVISASCALGTGVIGTAQKQLTVVEPVAEPICTNVYSVVEDGTSHDYVFNPCAVVVGREARYSIEVKPDDFPGERIVWSLDGDSTGSVEFVDGVNAGRIVRVRGATPGDARLKVRIGDATAAPPTFDFKVVTNSVVKLSAWIVCNEEGKVSRTVEEVRELVRKANDIYRQVGVTLDIGDRISITNIPQAYNILYEGTTNTMWNFDQLVNIHTNTCGLELYFVNDILDPNLEKKGRKILGAHDGYGIVISARGMVPTVAHEVGHAFGMDDVYVEQDDAEVGFREYVSEDKVPYDWSGGCCGSGVPGTRYYKEGCRLRDVIQAMLMNGRESDLAVGCDITYGPVDGVDVDGGRGLVETGFFQNPNRCPNPAHN